MPIPSILAERISRGEHIFFLLGAGASAAAHIPLDNPSPEGLGWALAIADTGSPELARAKFGENLFVANLLPTIDKVRLRQLLRQQNWQALDSTSCQKVLARLVLEGYHVEIATVNFDPLLERSFDELGVDVNVVRSRETLDLLRAGGHVILKIHGCPYKCRNPEELLVTAEDLSEGRPWITRMIESRFQESHCIYVGFSGNAAYVSTALAQIARESPSILSSHVVDNKTGEEVFDVNGQGPLNQFVRLSAVTPENYYGGGAEHFFQELGNNVVRTVLRGYLEQAVADANQLVSGFGTVDEIAETMRRGVIDQITWQYACDFVKRLESGLGGARTLRGAASNLRLAFKWMLTFICSGLLYQASVAPVLAYPLRGAEQNPPILIFGGDEFSDIREYAHTIEEKFKSDSRFRSSLGCEDDATVIAIAVRCQGDPTPERGELMPDAAESLLHDRLTTFVWRSDHQINEKFRTGERVTSL